MKNTVYILLFFCISANAQYTTMLLASQAQFQNEATDTPIYGSVISDGAGTIGGFEASKAFDNNISTSFYSFNSAGAWLGQDYGVNIDFDRVEILPKQDATDCVRLNNTDVQWSTNGSSWTTVLNITGVTSGNYTDYIIVDLTGVNARYIRLYFNATLSYGNVAEIKPYEQ